MRIRVANKILKNGKKYRKEKRRVAIRRVMRYWKKDPMNQFFSWNLQIKVKS